ncbi:MAG TPA: glycosyl hydrolase family 18 protein [Syntrophomonadaceae bacterium]|nr:glycosyl hydrolase family 18 protein [Syntrophomonadaceae bacterium]
MIKLWKQVAAVIILVFLPVTYMAQAASVVNISIDGKERQLNPPAQIVNDRTMVPLRFIVEDPALQGQVYWDQSQQKVAMDCRGRYIELYIGNKQAKVDGKACTLDAPPYIYQGRTYVPLRFLAENLGARVEWQASQRRVNIQFNQAQPRVFAYYYYTPWDELEQNAHLFTDIAFRWFATNSEGELYYEYKADYAKTLAWAKSKGIRTHASVVLMGSDALHTLLSNQKNRTRLINGLIQEVRKNGYDGVNIDFELMAASDAGNFTTFLRELKQALGTDTELSVAVFARTGKEKWATPYQYDQIGQIADSVVVMAYDYHYTTTAPGAIAPLWWVKEVAQYMAKIMPAEKVLMGMATYGYDWPKNSSATAVTAQKLSQLQSKYQVQSHWDEASYSPYYTYWDEKGRYHEVWLENYQSLTAKWQAVSDYNLGGVSFWRIGTGFTDLYQLLEEQL